MPRILLAMLLAGCSCACAGGGSAGGAARSASSPEAAPGPLRCAGARFELTAPEGWRSAPRAAEAHGMLAAFHPAERTWASARVVMLVRCDPGPADTRRLIARDKERFAKRSKLVVLGEADPVRTAAGDRIELRTFSGGPDGRNEAVAYLRVEGGIIRLILRAANQHSFESHLPAFEALLGSLRLGDWR